MYTHQFLSTHTANELLSDPCYHYGTSIQELTTDSDGQTKTAEFKILNDHWSKQIVLNKYNGNCNKFF